MIARIQWIVDVVFALLTVRSDFGGTKTAEDRKVAEVRGALVETYRKMCRVNSGAESKITCNGGVQE